MVDSKFFYQAIANQDVLPMQQRALRETNQVSYLSELNISSKPAAYRKVSLMCTIAPTCRDMINIEKMMTAGMNVARLNFSYGTREWHAESIQMIRQAEANQSQRLGYPKLIGIALDTRGPEVRTGLMDGDMAIPIRKGETIKLTTDKAYMNKGNASTIFIDYENILKIIQPEDRIFICDGQVPLLVTGMHGSNIICAVEADGIMYSSRTVFLPSLQVDLPPVSAIDREDIAFGIAHGIDFIMASCVRNAADVAAVREAIGPAAEFIKVIAKIETYGSLVQLDKIIDASDGIMINRQNIGIEIPSEKVFISQKNIIAKCNVKGKLVICAKQMMSSMLKNRIPTRAESVDIANAVLDGVDCLQISETATGLYAAECVRIVARICIEAEAAVHEVPRYRELVDQVPNKDMRQVIALAAVEAASKLDASAIIILAMTGRMVLALSKFRPKVPIIVILNNEHVARHMVCVRAVFPTLYPDAVHDKYTASENWLRYIEDRLNYGILYGKIHGFIRSGDPVVLVHGSSPDAVITDTMRIEYVSDIVKPICF